MLLLKIVQHVLKNEGDGTFKSWSTEFGKTAKFTKKGNVSKFKPGEVSSVRTIDAAEAYGIVAADSKYSKYAGDVKNIVQNNKEVLTVGEIPADKIKKAR